MNEALPKVGDSTFVEREGILSVAWLVNKMHCIWRETPNTDVGIDGQIEHINDQNEATGHLVAVQVKAGSSYIKLRGKNHIAYKPTEKHRAYWANHALPVLLVIFDPEKGKAYWIDARQYYRAKPNEKTLLVPLHNILDLTNKDRIFETCGAVGMDVVPVSDALRKMILAENRNPTFPLTFFDLFVHGMTNLAKKLFFSMSFCMDVSRVNRNFLSETEEEQAEEIQLSQTDYEFLDAYIQFLVSQDFVVYDYSDFMIDRDEWQMTSTILCPLAPRGIALRELIYEQQQLLLEKADLNISLCQETTVELLLLPSFPWPDLSEIRSLQKGRIAHKFKKEYVIHSAKSTETS